MHKISIEPGKIDAQPATPAFSWGLVALEPLWPSAPECRSVSSTVIVIGGNFPARDWCAASTLSFADLYSMYWRTTAKG